MRNTASDANPGSPFCVRHIAARPIETGANVEGFLEFGHVDCAAVGSCWPGFFGLPAFPVAGGSPRLFSNAKEKFAVAVGAAERGVDCADFFGAPEILQAIGADAREDA